MSQHQFHIFLTAEDYLHMSALAVAFATLILIAPRLLIDSQGNRCVIWSS